MDPKASFASSMPKENLHDFEHLAWYQAILHSPECQEIRFQSRTVYRNSTQYAFLNRTLATNDTIRACQAFQRTTPIPPEDQTAAPGLWKDGQRLEALQVTSLASGVDGHAGIAHGGLLGTLFDENLGHAALFVVARAVVTVQMTVRYRRSVPTPGVVLLRGWATGREGRKVWVRSVMEDGMGTVYAEAEALFIVTREKKM